MSRILTPLLLAALTLTVFAKLQDFGPESTLRRFHQAAIRGDVPTIDATTAEGANSPFVQALAQGIRSYAETGAPIQPLGMMRGPGEAICEVAYADRQSGMSVHLWVLKLRGRTWKINAEATYLGWRQSPGPRSDRPAVDRDPTSG